MLFCPSCANLLLVEKAANSSLRFYCKTCPYIFAVTDSFQKPMRLPAKKAVDDVLGGKEAWENVAQATLDGSCLRCGGKRAYYMQKQIRSADEPMTTFYKCSGCAYQWNEN